MTRIQIIWLITAGICGVAVGGGLFTIRYAKGLSYLSNDAEACANCHIMREHFSAWGHSAHKAVAKCNDCHTPSGFIPKYASKAENGFWHSLAFTTGNHPDPIRIKRHNLQITEASCRRCHAEVLHAEEITNQHQCTRCHSGVGHQLR